MRKVTSHQYHYWASQSVRMSLAKHSMGCCMLGKEGYISEGGGGAQTIPVMVTPLILPLCTTHNCPQLSPPTKYV